MRVDTCGTSCPQPVLMTKKALDNDPKLNSIEILTDNNTSKTNVKKFLTSNGFNVETSQDDGVFVLKGTK